MEINKLKSGDIIHCPTLEEALAICQLMHDKGMTWGSGIPYLNNHRWYEYEGDMCYRPSSGSYSKLKYYKQEGYNIIPASQFLNSNNYEIY